MLRTTMSSTYCTASASSFAEAGRACPSCADKTLSVSGISLLVSVFIIICSLFAHAFLAGCGLIYIINVPVLIIIINAVIIYLSELKAQEQNA